MLGLAFLIIQLFFALFIIFLTIAFFTGAPFVPSTDRTAEAMIALAHIKKGMKVYDLGSGNGKLLRLAQKHGARAVGFEINPFLVLLSKLTTQTHWKNFWHADISDANVVFVYLLPWRMERLEQYVRSQLKPGTLIVSNSFIFPHLLRINEDLKNHVYVFRI